MRRNRRAPQLACLGDDPAEVRASRGVSPWLIAGGVGSAWSIGSRPLVGAGVPTWSRPGIGDVRKRRNQLDRRCVIRLPVDSGGLAGVSGSRHMAFCRSPVSNGWRRSRSPPRVDPAGKRAGRSHKTARNAPIPLAIIDTVHDLCQAWSGFSQREPCSCKPTIRTSRISSAASRSRSVSF